MQPAHLAPLPAAASAAAAAAVKHPLRPLRPAASLSVKHEAFESRSARLSALVASVSTAGAAVSAVHGRRLRRRNTARLVFVRPSASLDVNLLRLDFPALQQETKPGVPLVYLDNAATSQKPKQVLAELNRFYSKDNSNVHRGMHTLSIRATEAYEGARAKVARFVNARDAEEIVFTRNATESINLVARTWGSANLKEGDEILLTVMEHHSNLVPWQQLAEVSGARLRFARLQSNGQLDMQDFEQLLGNKTKLVALCHVSNVLGCVNPIQTIAEKAHAIGARLLVDACQSVPHMPVDVQALGADWLVASSHKMCGPSGIGFLWGRADILRESPPFLGGGEMIDEVTLERSTYNDIPHRFEAGTPAFAEAAALGVACDYLNEIGMENVAAREHALTEYLWRRVAELPGVIMYGPSPAEQPQRASLVCFNVEGCHANDLATLVDQEHGIAMRSGHHCTQPLHAELGITASARLSAYFYNTEEEIDAAVEALKAAITLVRSGSAPGGSESDAPAELDPAMAAALDI
eukprot:TRINITY_DN7372_c0_g1_i1.p1 TRINITY_DN7372_c0_g1~~TRINITY_DN7372_c0_g1_i1.p1  ORF type:complete len:523 (+),score=80.60 TRINITY_DN7372_c0_g1_i1:78-1646(+)